MAKNGKMSIAQKRAIGYAVRERAEERRRAFLDEHEGGIKVFEAQKRRGGYKTTRGYIKSKYNIYIY